MHKTNVNDIIQSEITKFGREELNHIEAVYTQMDTI